MSKRSSRRKKKAAQANKPQGKTTQSSSSPPVPVDPPQAIVPTEPLRIPTTSTVEPDASPPWKLSTKIIVIVSAMALFVLVLWRFSNFITPAILGAIVAYLLNPLIRLTSQRLKIGRGWSVAIVYVVTIAIVLTGGTLLILIGLGQLSELNTFLTTQIPIWWDDIQQTTAPWIAYDGINQITINIGTFFDPIVITLPAFIANVIPAPDIDLRSLLDVRSLIARAGTILQTTFTTGGSFVFRFAQGTIGIVGNLALAIFISIYLAKDTPRFVQALTDAAHVPGYGKDADRLILQFEKIWSAYLRGQVTLAITIFLVVGIALSILGVNNAWGLAVVSGVTEFLPLIGPVIGAGVAIVAALLQSPDTISWGMTPLTLALVVTVVMVIIQQVENAVLVPRIVGGALDLHPLLVLVGVLMGTSIGGILGALLAAPVLATIKLLGRYAWRKLFDLPPFDEEEEPEDESPSLYARAISLLQSLRGNRPLAKGR